MERIPIHMLARVKNSKSIMTEPTSNIITSIEKLPEQQHPHGRITNAPLIDDHDDEESFRYRMSKPPPALYHDKVSENSYQEDLPQPLTGLWRFFSDQIAREGVQNADEKRNGFPQEVTAASSDTPAVVDTTFDEEEETEGERSRNIFPDDTRSFDDEDSEDRNSPAILFQDTFSETARESTSKTSALYLDPDLVRHAHSKSEELRRRRNIPKVVHIPSEAILKNSPSGSSTEEANRATAKTDVVESNNPGEFVKVHGKRHARSAIEKGQSTIVRCSVCQKRFQVDRKAKALYCTFCDSVTQLTKQTLSHSV